MRLSKYASRGFEVRPGCAREASVRHQQSISLATIPVMIAGGSARPGQEPGGPHDTREALEECAGARQTFAAGAASNARG